MLRGMHPVLYVSSVAMALMHAGAIAAFGAPWPLLISYVCGPLLSVWNHGSWSRAAKLADRAAMAAGLALDVMWAARNLPGAAGFTGALGLELAAVGCYACAKAASGGEALRPHADVKPLATLLHVAAHALVSCAHGSLLLDASRSGHTGAPASPS